MDSTTHPPWRNELAAMLRLALPVVTVQVGMMAMGFVDSVMVGRFSETALAAVAAGNAYFNMVSMFGIGVLLALDPVMSQAVGARDEGSIRRNLQRGVVLAVALAIPTGVGLLVSGPAFRLFDQPAELMPAAQRYVEILIASVLPFYLYQVLRTTLQAFHRTQAIVWTILVANGINVFLNWVLIYGNLGASPLGSDGSAYATLASRWVMFFTLAVVGRRQLVPYLAPWTRRAFEAQALRRLVRVGTPIGSQITLEYGAFGIVLLMMGQISVAAQAGHQVAIVLASMTYMFGLGISSATGVRVGNGVGRGDLAGARWSAALGMGLGVAVMGVFALMFLLVPGALAGMFTYKKQGAFEVAVALLPIAAVFQVMDGVQVVALGILRGVADTRVPMLINLFGFWCLGIPAGMLFGFELRGGPEGLWWGLTIGLAVVSTFLSLRVWSRLRGELSRTVIDDSDALDVV